ncbi:DUF4097 family beta strand repeat-containing protein [Thalassotalea euphylliae]|uniref:DUF4097 domain-containing protein n=1 Tax=Thalassotalea euphylliae TaxID=1655234 RepID=A0A3E0UHL8_9GAMM|nr:DUF4097 family beta strand repeat-containing protein [Thalassotalea euphylliae]REL36370.1 hypothetical protein DXX92_14195 [Thalassotalea euphylliae]
METLNPKLLLPLVLCSGVATSVFAEETRVIEQSFSIEQGAEFSIENINGRVEVGRASGDQIEVTATLIADSEDDLERIKVLMEHRDNEVMVETKYLKRDWGKGYSSGKVNYEVNLPANVTETEIDLVNGSLTVSDILGRIDADLVNGSIDASGISGTSKLHSVNGSVTARFADLEQVEKVKIDTVNGSIKVYLPTDAQIKVNAETMHGSIKSDFGLKVDKNLFTGKQMKGVVGSGSTKLTLDSVNGSIKVLSN